MGLSGLSGLSGISMGNGGSAPVVPWYLSGGVASENCLAAYLSKGAASYAASKLNIANPGAHDLSEGTGGAVAWATGTGWVFNNDSTKVLKTDIVPAIGTTTAIVQFSNASSGYVLGCLNLTPVYFYMHPVNSTNVTYAAGGVSGAVNRSPQLASGNLAISGLSIYRNGAQDGADIVSSGDLSGVPIYIGAGNLQNIIAASPFIGRVYAVAIYNTALTPAQISAVAASMASF